MAEVKEPTIASDKKAEQPKKKIFGVDKKPNNVVYRLIEKNDRTMRTDTPEYPPSIRFPNKDIIVWEYKNQDGTTELATREIRWLPGEQSIFVDEQEKDGRKIPENILNNPNNRFEIIEGYIRVRPHERTKIQFLDYCNRNIDSPYRTGTVAAKFRRYTDEIRTQELRERQEKQKEAMNKAFGASPDLVYYHAINLNIPLIDNLTQGSRDIESITADYRQMAMDNPVEFLKIFDDENLTAKFNMGNK